MHYCRHACEKCYCSLLNRSRKEIADNGWFLPFCFLFELLLQLCFRLGVVVDYWKILGATKYLLFVVLCLQQVIERLYICLNYVLSSG